MTHRLLRLSYQPILSQYVRSFYHFWYLHTVVTFRSQGFLKSEVLACVIGLLDFVLNVLKFFINPSPFKVDLSIDLLDSLLRRTHFAFERLIATTSSTLLYLIAFPLSILLIQSLGLPHSDSIGHLTSLLRYLLQPLPDSIHLFLLYFIAILQFNR